MTVDPLQLEQRSEFELFHNLGQLHVLRAYEFASGEPGDYQFCWQQARTIEEMLGRIAVKRGDAGDPWGAGRLGSVVADPHQWRNAFYKAVPEGEEDVDVAGALIGASAARAVISWNPQSVAAPDALRDSRVARRYLQMSQFWLDMRAEALEQFVANRTRWGTNAWTESEVVPPPNHAVWKEWASSHRVEVRSSLALMALDVRRGVEATIVEGARLLTSADEQPPEVLGTYLRQRGAVANSADLLEAGFDASGVGVPEVFDQAIARSVGDAYRSALARTGSAQLQSSSINPPRLEL